MQGACSRCEAALDVVPDLLDMRKALKVHRVFDIVTAESKHTNCFTKGYRKNFFGAGSVVVSPSFASNFCEASYDGRLVISDAGKQKLLEICDKDLTPCEQVLLEADAHVHRVPPW